MIPVQPRDKRGFIMLPQKPENAGYYTYGTPAHGAGQYADPRLLTLLLMTEYRWQAVDKRKIGLGNISLAGGGRYKGHDSHRTGRDVDIRLFRKDGREAPATRFDPEYDRDATAKLIGMFFESLLVKVIFFNDLTIPGVRPLIHHDDHFHITIKE